MAEKQALRELKANVQIIKAVVPEGGVVISLGGEPEDMFREFYNTTGGQTEELIKPQIVPEILERMVLQNSALPPCIDAMEASIEGTGAELAPAELLTDDMDLELDPIDPMDPEAAVERERQLLEQRKAIRQKTKTQNAEKKRIWDFFEQCAPGQSFHSLRCETRRDLEQTGNAYWEIQTNSLGELVFIKQVPSRMMRLVRLDQPAMVKTVIRRGGEDVEFTHWVRERRYAMRQGSNLTYFKELGASRQLNRDSGQWEAEGRLVPANKRANQVLHFTLIPDPTGPYGLPRWFSQVPSILGQRQAEELNLSYFKKGGIPPVLVLVHGGRLSEDSSRAIRQALNGGKNQEAAIVEAFDAQGSLDEASNIKITVERFGQLKEDSMFENYADQCEIRIRKAFRIPPIFVGLTDDYNRATVESSYAVAEAQVFAPERTEMDEIINLRIMPMLDPNRQFKFRSLPLTVKSVTDQRWGVEQAVANGLADGEEVVKQINEITHLDIMYSDAAYRAHKQATQMARAFKVTGPQASNAPPTETRELQKNLASPMALVALAESFVTQLAKGVSNPQASFEVAKLLKQIHGLPSTQIQMLKQLMTFQFLGQMDGDVEGATDLMGCALAMLGSRNSS